MNRLKNVQLENVVRLLVVKQLHVHNINHVKIKPVDMRLVITIKKEKKEFSFFYYS